jgi:hypothetical protein
VIEIGSGEKPDRTRKLSYKDDKFVDICSTRDDLSGDVLDINTRRREKHLLNYRWEHLKSNELCIEAAQEFCQNVTEDFQLEFLSLCYPEDEDRIIDFSDDTIDFILENDYLFPQFNLITDKKRGRILQKLGFENQRIRDSVVLILELPEILITKPKEDEDIPKEIIDLKENRGKGWRHLQTSLIQSIWKHIRQHHENGEVTFQRLNSKKEHEPRKYYYIWKIWEKLYK